MEMKRRGADRVVGIDSDEGYLAQARFAAEVSGLDIEFRKLDVYDVAKLGEKFDLVLFMGVLYHLRHPLLALDLLHEHVAGDMLVFQSLMRGNPDTAEFERDYPFSETGIFEDPAIPPHVFRRARLLARLDQLVDSQSRLRRRPCCAARDSKSSIIPKTKCSSASAWRFIRCSQTPCIPRRGGLRNDRGRDVVERAE